MSARGGERRSDAAGPGVLERNLELLLRRAYVPALPAPDYRARLLALWRAAVLRSARARPMEIERRWRVAAAGRHVATRRSSLVAAAAVAAALLLAFLFGRGGSDPAPSKAELLAAGSVALEEGGAWRAASTLELERGLRLGTSALSVATPAARELELLLDDGSATVAAASEVALDPAPDAAGPLHLRLAAGDLRLVRSAAPAGNGREPWVLETAYGGLLFHEGELAADAGAGGVELRLAAGRAVLAAADGSWSAAPDAAPLEPGVPYLLVAGRLVAPEPETAVAETDPERHALAPGAAPETTVPSVPAPAAGSGRIRGRVALAEHLAAAGEALGEFEVGLLELRAQNEPTFAVARSSASLQRTAEGELLWDGLTFGTYAVFVHAPGFALAHGGTFELDSGAPEARFEATLTRGGALRGYVVDAANGDPVAGALIVSERDSPCTGLSFHDEMVAEIWLPISARSRADGGFELPHLSAGEHLLKVSAPGFAPSWTRRIAIAEGSVVEEETVGLGVPGGIEGLVTDARGQPFAGAELITFLGEGDHGRRMTFATTTTDAEGRYAFRDLPPELLLVLLIPGPDGPLATSRVLPASLSAGKVTRVDFRGETSGTRLVGVLRDTAGRPLGGQNLACFPDGELSRGKDWTATVTGAAGEYAFEDLAPGKYLLYFIGEMGASLFLLAEIDVPPVPELVRDISLGTCRLEGRVSAGATGAAVPALLILERGDVDGEGFFAGLARTDAEGRYRFETLAAGRYSLTAYPLDGVHGFEHEPPFDLGDVGTSGQATAEGAARTLDFTLFPGGSAVVLVVDEQGAPVVGATVVFVDELGRGFSFAEEPVTDAEGRHVARGLRPGLYRVRVERDGRETLGLPFECREGAQHEVRLELRTQDHGPAEDPLRAEPSDNR